jgi:uncharacterized protein YicC (UPF0701 family)
MLMEQRGSFDGDLAREISILADKLDVSEELSRLEAHLQQLDRLLAKGGAVGRKLDFLAQEFNREANTLCSKSQDIELTRIGLDLGKLIGTLRSRGAGGARPRRSQSWLVGRWAGPSLRDSGCRRDVVRRTSWP